MIQGPIQRRRIVLHSENGPVIGGSDYYLGRIIDGLDHERWKVYLLARPNYPIAEITRCPELVEHLEYGPALRHHELSNREHSGVADRPVNLPSSPRLISRVWSRAPRNWRRDLGLIRDSRRVTRILQPIRPDIFHTVDGGPQPAAIGASKAGAAVVLGYSSPTPSEKSQGLCRWIEMQACQLAAARITKSSFTSRSWAEYLDVSSDSFQVIPNGIDATEFTRHSNSACRQELGLPVDKFIVGMTARLEKEKGVEAFVQAGKILAQSIEPIHFVIAGDGDMAVALRRSIDASNMQSRFTFLGHRNDIPQVTATYDVAVVPSIWDEPFGWVVLEAMAARKPVIASKVGGIPEIIDHARTGLLVEPKSVSDLIAAIHGLYLDPTQRQKLANNAYNEVLERFSRDQMLKQTIGIYDGLCRRGLPLHKQDSSIDRQYQTEERTSCGPV